MLKPYKKDSAMNRTHYNYLCRKVQRSGRADKEAYLNELCQNVEEASVLSKSRMVYQSIKLITGKKAPRVSAIKDNAGKILTDPQDIKDRWKEHFDQLYNVNITADATIISQLPTEANDEQSNNTAT